MLLVSLTACSACGTQKAAPPALSRADAQPLAALAQQIAAEGPCAQRRDIARLQRQAISLVDSRRVPAELQDPLISGVNALAAETPVCLPSVPVTTTPPPGPPGHGKGHDKHHHDHGHGEND